MTDDLDTLRPEIRDAVDSLDKSEGIDFAWLAVRAEMLRLARESDEWQTRCLQFQTERDKAQARAELAALKARSFHPRAQLLTNLATANERAERAEAELTLAHRERDRMFLDAREWATRFGEMEARAEKAEAELAALKDENAQLRDVLADRDMDREMAAHANKELAALKARIAEAPVASVRVDDRMHVSIGARSNAVDFVPLHTKHVALVKVEE